MIIYINIAVDLIKSLTRNQSWGKTALNSGINLLPFLIGTGPGLAIGLGYIALDGMGAFDPNPTDLPPYTPPSYAVPDAMRVVTPMIYP